MTPPEDEQPRDEAAQFARDVEQRPEHLSTAETRARIAELLTRSISEPADTGELETRTLAATTVARLSEIQPGEMSEFLPDLARILEAELDRDRFDPGTLAAAERDARRRMSIGIQTNAITAIEHIYREDGGTIDDNVVGICARCATGNDAGLTTRALSVLSLVAETSPGRVEPHVDVAVDHLDHDDSAVVANALGTLGTVAHASPEQAGPHVDAIARHLDAMDSEVLGNALHTLAHGAEAVPDRLGPHVDAIADRLDEVDQMVLYSALACLLCVAEVDPGRIGPHVDAISAHLADDDPNVHWLVLGILDFVAKDAPAEVEPHVDTIADHLDHGNAEIVAEAIGALRGVHGRRA